MKYLLAQDQCLAKILFPDYYPVFVRVILDLSVSTEIFD